MNALISAYRVNFTLNTHLANLQNSSKSYYCSWCSVTTYLHPSVIA